MSTPAPKLPDLEMIKVIGTGSYGEVWLAKTVTGMFRAVKIVDRSRFPDERPWLREFAGISRFQKDMGGRPRQLALLHVGEDRQQGIFYYVMELADDLVKGADIDPAAYVPCTLKALRDAREEGLPFDEVLRIGIDLTRSLAELHGAGLIHRDVKPSNIVFVQGSPKLADLGLVSSSDHTLTSLGTPGYSPPEGAATPRSDIFSLGRILYELAMLLPSAEFPRLPADLASRADASRLMELNEILLTACNPDPEKRYQDASALLTDLLHVQAGGSMVEMARLRERLAKAAAVAKWAAAIVLAVGLVFGVRHYQALRRLAAEEAAGRARAEQEEREARYVADLQLAQVGAQASDYGIAVSALQRQIPAPGRPDLRGAEWWTLWNQLRGDQDRLVSLGTTIRSAAPSADGSALLCILPEQNRDAVLIRPETGERTPISGANLEAVGAQARDGSFIANTWDSQVLDLREGGLPPVIWKGLKGTVRASNADRALVYSAHSSTQFDMILLDRREHREAGRWTSPEMGSETNFRCVALSASGRYMAINILPKGETLKLTTFLVDLESGRELWSFSEATMFNRMAFSPDGKLLALTGNDHFRIVETAGGTTKWECEEIPGKIEALAWSPDGKFLAVGSLKARIGVFEVAEQRSVSVLQGAQTGIVSLAWSADNKVITSAESDGSIRSFKLNGTSTASFEQGLAAAKTCNFGDLLFDKEPGRCLATLADGSLGLIQLHPWKILQRWNSLLMPLANRREQGWFALDARGGLVICLPDGSFRETGLALPKMLSLSDWSTSPDQRYCAFVIDCSPGTLVLWDLQELKAAEYTTTIQALRTVQFDQNSRWLAISDNKNGLRLLNLETRSMSEWIGRKGIRTSALAFTADGRRAFLGYADGQLQEMDLETRTLGKLVPAHHDRVTGLVLLDQGATLLSTSRDGTYSFYRTEKLRHVLTAPAKSTLQDDSPTSIYAVRGRPGSTPLALLGTNGSVQFIEPESHP